MSMYKPYIDSRLNLGFMGWETQIMKESFERFEFTYVVLRWYFFKWDGYFRLYKPGEDMKR